MEGLRRWPCKFTEEGEVALRVRNVTDEAAANGDHSHSDGLVPSSIVIRRSMWAPHREALIREPTALPIKSTRSKA
jgi:hypothetical protein